MKPNCCLLNFAREELVDTLALKSAYESGDYEGKYIADFAVPDLHNKGFPVLEIPHLGASTEEAESNSAAMAARQITDFLEQGIIRNSVNFPTCVPPRLDKPADGKPITRMIMVNSNEKGMLAEITTVLGDFKCNILQHINTSKGEIAYNIIDMADFPQNPQDLQLTLGKIKGVRSSRIMVGDPGTHFFVAAEGTMGYF